LLERRQPGNGQGHADGQPDPSIFSTEYNREGIRLGTSVGLFAKTGGKDPVTVRYREFWGTGKRVDAAEDHRK
jgi:hypothetical protein